MATKDDFRSHDRVENSWYELVAEQLQALIPKVGIEEHRHSYIRRMS